MIAKSTQFQWENRIKDSCEEKKKLIKNKIDQKCNWTNSVDKNSYVCRLNSFAVIKYRFPFILWTFDSIRLLITIANSYKKKQTNYQKVKRIRAKWRSMIGDKENIQVTKIYWFKKKIKFNKKKTLEIFAKIEMRSKIKNITMK